MHHLKQLIHAFVPKEVFSLYHFTLAAAASVYYRFPSRYITVIGVTGTKGKSSTTEYINAICEAEGYKTALSNSIRMKVGAHTLPQKGRMSMPGRFALQKFLREALDQGCTCAIIEMTSEGAAQSRQRFVSMDALVFTNLAPEHIESHGSLENYQAAKLAIGKTLSRSSKRPRTLVLNKDDAFSVEFSKLPADNTEYFSLSAVEPYSATDTGGYITFEGTRIDVHLPGEFSLQNALAAATLAQILGISLQTIARGVSAVTRIPGRAEVIESDVPFTVVVDYAHNPSSLEAIYGAYAHRRKICVLGSTGGGRDQWKRPEMGRIADTMCDEVILTNEDPYDEEPMEIVSALQSGMSRKPYVEIDRRLAIRYALRRAQPNDVVLITGKGTDPSIKGRGGTAEKWSDAEVAREELRALRDARHGA